jgi:hypothetical protein
MNIDIQDRAVFDSLEPEVITRYLVARGWQEIKRVPNEMAVYELSHTDSEPYRVWVPLSRRFSDYASVMSNAFKTLAEVDNKSQLAMLDDLQTQAIGDVIRVGSEDRLDRAEHTLLLNDGITLHEQARQMALAGAWNAISGKTKKPVYPQSSRAEITRYMQKLRLAQTERGSFIIRLISPLREEALNQLPLSPDIPIETPFERRALVELLGGLKALKQAANDVNRRGKFHFKTFEEAVSDGVSANLCDAVAPSIFTDYWRPVKVSITWCDVFPVPIPITNTNVEFDLSLMPYIREAGTEFRKRNPEEVVLRGAVTDLHRPSKKTEGAGEVRIYSFVSGKARYVRVALGQTDYELAVDAHKTYREVSVSGVLVPKLGVFILDKPSNFHVITEGAPE